MTAQKLLYIFDQNDWQSRMPLAVAAADKGWKVTVGVVGNGKPLSATKDYDGINFLPLEKPAGRLNPTNALSFVKMLRKVLRDEAPDLLHTVTLKYTFLTGLARMFNTKAAAVYTIAGLGFLFRSAGLKPQAVRTAIYPLLRSVLRAKNTTVIFQNPDDRDLLLQGGYVTPDNSLVILGSGVDLKRFAASSLSAPKDNEKPLVLMPTRLVKEKGVDIFVQAARKVQQNNINADFAIAGGLAQHNPKAITEKEMQALTSDCAVNWLGRVEDMPALLERATLIVYPSHYGEGIPRVLLEAAASGRPIITTDHPGCREAVAHEDNGLLVPVRNAEALAEAIEKLLQDDKTLRAMGKRSRERAEQEFDLHHVVRQTLAVYGKH